MSAAPAPASRVFLFGCRSGKEAGGLSKPGVAGPQGKSFRLAEAPCPVVPRAMPAPLALSSSGAPADSGFRSAPGAEGGAAAGRRGGPDTSRVPSWLLSAAARHLQLTSPKFPAPAPPRPSRRARLGACARVCAAPRFPLYRLLGPEPSRRRAEVLEEGI